MSLGAFYREPVRKLDHATKKVYCCPHCYSNQIYNRQDKVCVNCGYEDSSQTIAENLLISSIVHFYFEGDFLGIGNASVRWQIFQFINSFFFFGVLTLIPVMVLAAIGVVPVGLLFPLTLLGMGVFVCSNLIEFWVEFTHTENVVTKKIVELFDFLTGLILLLFALSIPAIFVVAILAVF